MSNRFFVNLSRDAGQILEERWDGLYSPGGEGSGVPEAPDDGYAYARKNLNWINIDTYDFNNVVVIESDSARPSVPNPKILYVTIDLGKLWISINNNWVLLNPSGGGTGGIDNIVNIANADALPTTAPANILYITHNDLKLYQYSDSEWKILNSGGSVYVLPVATNENLGGVKTPIKTSSDTTPVKVDSEGGLWVEPGSYELPITNSTTLGGVLTPPKTSAETVQVTSSEDGTLWTIPGSGGGAPTDIESTDFDIGGSNYSRTVNIKTGGLVTNQFANNSITTPKIAPGLENQVLRTITNTEAELITSWTEEQDISNKADKFLYTPNKGTETLYNLTDIQLIKVEGNGAGVNPNTGIVYTNFAGEQTIIPIQSDAGFFHYQGQVKTYERLPEFDNIKNGDLYSIYGPISYQGEVALVGDLPSDYTEADDLKQYYINSVKEYRYWSQPTSADTGEWVTNHCQTEQGCDDTGYYAFGIGDTPSWNRLDSELTIDQVLDITSHNAIANSAVTEGLNLRVTYQDAEETLDYCISNIFPTPE